MFLTVLILSSILKDFQVDAFINNSFPVGQEINKNFALQSIPNSCAGKTVEACEKYRPQELQQCKSFWLQLTFTHLVGVDSNPSGRSSVKLTTGYDEVIVCGLINGDPTGPIPFIIGGSIVKPSYLYPWMVKIEVPINVRTIKSCGGAIISANYVLTAAHCVKKKIRENGPSRVVFPHELRIRFLTRTYALTPGATVEKIIPHPKHNATEDKHDIALIKLEENINCGIYSNPICLPPANVYPEENTLFRYTGWGHTSGDKDAEGSKKLKEGMGRLVECSKYYSRNDANNYYCLMSVRKQRPCKGDSGGSMFFSRNGIFYTMGVDSYGTCRSDVPTGFASVPRVLQWISKITGLSPSE